MLRFIAVVYLFVFGTPQALAEERLAILEFRNIGKAMSATEIGYIADIFRDLGAKIGRQGPSIMTKENILQLLPPGKSLEQCQGECEVETGRNIGADYVLSGEVRKISNELGFRLTAKIHQTKAGTLLSSEIYEGLNFKELENDIRGNQKKDIFKSIRIKPTSAFSEKTFGENGQAIADWSDKTVIVKFDSQPKGALVEVEGKVICKETPCSRELSLGSYSLSMKLEDYVSEHRGLDIKEGMEPVNVILKADFGFVTLITDPKEGLDVFFDGKSIGKTPLKPIKAAPRPHKLIVTGESYFEKGIEFTIKQGEDREINLKAEPKLAALRISAKTRMGNAVEATVEVNGIVVGKTPFQGAILIGIQKIAVYSDDGRWEQTIVLKLGDKQVVEVTLEKIVFANSEEKKSYFRKSCENKGAKACYLLGLEEFESDKPAALKLYKLSCSYGYLVGCAKMNYESRNKQEARRLYKKSCDGGEMEGCLSLGLLEDKSGNKAGAIRLYETACDGGNMIGCRNLGFLKENSGNKFEAIQLFEKACDGGEIIACSHLGGFEEAAGNQSEARRLYTKACDGGEIIACDRLGDLEEKSGNKDEASRLFKKACDRGGLTLVACLSLGALEETSGNKVEASRLYKKACDGGEMTGCLNLGVLEDESGNKVEARSLYKKACNGGKMLGCSNLGVLEDESGNKVEARRLYKKACNGGKMLGCSNLGVLENKSGNKDEASRLFKKACDGAEMLACDSLGLLAKKAGNKAEASRLFKKACDGGVMLACDSLGDLEKKAGNKAEASRLYKKACDGGVMLACDSLGDLEEKLGNKDEASRLFKKACDSGVTLVACLSLGVLEEKSGNKDEASRLYKKACDGGEMTGCLSLGVLEDESGNNAEARRLYKKACDGGAQDGCKWLN